MRELNCDILIAGGGTGGTAAALHAAHLGSKVILLEETDWLGGQLTAQGVSALDEHPHIEYFGGTQSYYQLRNAIRQHYAREYRLAPRAYDSPEFNPGNCWVTKCAFEPTVAVAKIKEMLAPLKDKLDIIYFAQVIELKMQGDRIESALIRLAGSTEEVIKVKASCFIDATELGDLLPLADAEYVLGRESKAETGEPDAYDTPDPDCIQSFTFPFIVEWRPGDNHTIEKPIDYEALKTLQRYSFKDNVIEDLFEGQWSLWTYRRLLAAENFDDASIPFDVCLINTASNDYRGPAALGKSPEEAARVLAEARRASLGYLYWMQTEAPRSDGKGFGYPELKLRKDLLGTDDGISKTAYFRESRRMKTLDTIKEQDVVVRDGNGNLLNPGPRAKECWDTVGIGWYNLDCHRSATGDPGRYWPTRPFQIPLGALIPVRIENLIPACKNIGTTHLSNGCYRLHPVEWAIGQAAGTIAHFSLEETASLKAIYEDRSKVKDLQRTLLAWGAPLYWYVDVPIGDEVFSIVQQLAIEKRFKNEITPDLRFRPDDPLTIEEALIWGNKDLTDMPRRYAAMDLGFDL